MSEGTNAARRPRIALVILDGWGLREPADDNAVHLATTPNWDEIWSNGDYPRSRLTTDGRAVGLPDGQMGNSEVGHLNLGAGRVVVQSLLRISEAIESGEFFENPRLIDLMAGVRESGATLHLMGLIGPGGVHAVDSHLLALCEMADRHGLPKVCIHAFLDGRDTPPQSARDFLTELVGRAGANRGCGVATIIGRYWAMDRDKRWDRTEKAYRAIVYGEGVRVRNPVTAVQEAYDSSETDEFIKPRVVVDESGEPIGRLQSGDAVFFFNFRADRVRQITRALAEEEFPHFDRGPDHPRVEVVTMTQYDKDFPLTTAFPPQDMRNILADVLAEHGRTSYRTAETEKYPHVTYFFNGGVEEPRPGETREMVQSPRVATYDLQPEMSAPEVGDRLVEAIQSRAHDVIVCNFANPDMVGHTGVLEAAIRAVETVDEQLGRAIAACRETATTLLVTADHGNCEQMWDPDTNGPHTAHTTNQVGIVLLEPENHRTAQSLAVGALCDVAPTILGLIDLPQPPEMGGRICAGRRDGAGLSRKDHHRKLLAFAAGSGIASRIRSAPVSSPEPLYHPQRPTIMRHVGIAILGALLCLLPAGLSAQSITSPFDYIETRHSAGFYAGYLDVSPGSLDLAPSSTPLFGGRYNIRLVGPLNGEIAMAFGSSDRTVYLPIGPDAEQPLEPVGESSVVLMTGEAGVRFDFTGARSWRRLTPFGTAAIGFVADLTGGSEAEAQLADEQRFEFGPAFAASIGLGSDFFLTERFSVRLEARDYLWRLSYPPAFSQIAQRENEWRHNFAITLGGSIHF